MSDKSGKQRRLPKLAMPKYEETPTHNLEDFCKIKFDNQKEAVEVRAQDLQAIELLGRGAYGVVEKMMHVPTGNTLAVKRIHSYVNDEIQKRTLVELQACIKSDSCPQMVRFYGAMFREGDVWICMEVMDISLDKFYQTKYERGQLPEMFCAKVALSVTEGLNFMKQKMNLIHRDVKPSNILLNKQGSVKICDFGISGNLTNSVAKTVNAGCTLYMPPERIDGERKNSYDVRADVWSLGITLIEIATGSHPYSRWMTPFEQLKQVVYEDSPKLQPGLGYSDTFRDFIARCLTKDYKVRPKYPELLAHGFLKQAKDDNEFDIGEFITRALEKDE